MPCPTLVGCPHGHVPIEEILTQKGDEDPGVRLNSSAQFGVKTNVDGAGSGVGSGVPWDCWAAAAQHLFWWVEQTYGSQQTCRRQQQIR